jgi:DNA replication initiation complex subunit (GINS family)
VKKIQLLASASSGPLQPPADPVSKATRRRKRLEHSAQEEERTRSNLNSAKVGQVSSLHAVGDQMIPAIAAQRRGQASQARKLVLVRARASDKIRTRSIPYKWRRLDMRPVPSDLLP